MGRPKLEKATTSTERMQKYQADCSKRERERENVRRKVCRNKKVATLTAEELEEKKRYDRQRKA